MNQKMKNLHKVIYNPDESLKLLKMLY